LNSKNKRMTDELVLGAGDAIDKEFQDEEDEGDG
jgi:hypothetical protein